MGSTHARNINIDLIKCLAVFGVVSVHFFVYIGFYAEPLVGSRMFVLNGIRTAFMTCVPLFLLVTGYLMRSKKLREGGRYYKGLVRNISTYVLASIACIIYLKIANPAYILADGIAGILSFKVTEYAWYMEMYLGLFLLIPFLNIIFCNLETKKAKLVLIGTFGLLTVGPTIFNLGINLVPDWWLPIWPVTYYFIGCFLGEYKIRSSRPSLVLLAFVVWAVICASWNYLHARTMPGMVVDTSDLYWWSSIQNVVSSVLLFIWVESLDLSKLPDVVKSIIVRISKLSLGLYLVSFVFDKLYYPYFLVGTDWVGGRLELYPFVVPLVFLSALLSSQVINWIYEAFAGLLNAIRLRSDGLVDRKA